MKIRHQIAVCQDGRISFGKQDYNLAVEATILHAHLTNMAFHRLEPQRIRFWLIYVAGMSPGMYHNRTDFSFTCAVRRPVLSVHRAVPVSWMNAKLGFDPHTMSGTF